MAGIVVVATENDYSGGWQRSRNRGTTDAEGNYRINNVPTGKYLIYPVAPALVVENGQPNQRLAVTAGETIRDINFAMVQGGVITGKITEANGQPLIDEVVTDQKDLRASLRREAEAAKTAIELKPCQDVTGCQLKLNQ